MKKCRLILCACVISALALTLGAPRLGAQEKGPDPKLIAGKTLKQWIVQLSSSQARSRLEAAYILERMGEKGDEAIPHLIKASRNPDLEFRRRIARALSTKGPKVVSALISALKDKSELCRGTAAYTLGLMQNKDPSAIPALVEACGDSIKSVRISAWSALASFGKAALPAVLKALQDKNELLRESAADAARLMGPVAAPALPILVQNLKDKSEKVRASSAYAIGSLGENAKKAFVALRQLYEDMEEKDHIRASAVYSLSQLGTVSEKLIPSFLKTLNDRNERVAVRGATAQALGKLGGKDPKILRVLILNARDSFEEIRFFAVLGIGSLGKNAEAAVSALTKCYSNRTESARVRSAAVQSLGLIGQKAIPTLIDALGVKFDKVAFGAIRALESLALRELQQTVTALLKGVKHPNPKARRGIAILFGQLRVQNTRIIDALNGLAKDADPGVRSAAERALFDLGVSQK
ncbi:MAG: HEAT repeat domain-containing protein [Planctomycetota bacterium]|nr:HEAT repeat domain-containing protein [Planctomycetota bacterium]